MWAKLAKMSVREAMISLAGKPGYGEQPRWFGAIADAANISKRMARSLWRGEIQSPDHRAVLAIERAIEQKRAREEALALADQYERIIGGMRAQDEDFFGPQIDRLERNIDQIRALDRT